MKKYLAAYEKLGKFVEPLTKSFCSPCQYYRGPYGCCIEGSFALTQTDIRLNSIKSFVPVLGRKCRFLKDGCSLKHKPDICLIYLCGMIMRGLTSKEQNKYWKLRENLSEECFKLETQ